MNPTPQFTAAIPGAPITATTRPTSPDADASPPRWAVVPDDQHTKKPPQRGSGAATRSLRHHDRNTRRPVPTPANI